MKTSSTFKIIAFMAILLTTVSLQAQTFFEITSPASIAGTYAYNHPATWGGDFPDCLDNFTIEGELEIIADNVAADTTGVFTDGCEVADNDLTGKIALVDRGACQFSTKALNAQNAGAIAVIICNNVPGDPAPGLAAGTAAPMVTIPVWSLSFEDCQTIRVEIPTVMGRVFWMPPPVGSDVVLWGANTGEGDFNGGLNGWTTENISCANGGMEDLWVWDADADAILGAFSAGGGVSTANTACNGAMVFDSDYYDNGGDAGNLGGGSCTADQVGELISPAIDLSAVASGVTGVSLKFHQATRQFTSTYIVSYSNDDGASWFDVEINPDFEVNSAHINELERIFLPEADLNSTAFRIKFRYEANYYYWIIDDVQLIETEANNLRVMSNFYAIAPNAVTPISQVEPFSHLADVYNAGSVQQTNVNLNVTITDDDNNVVFTDDNSYTPIPADSLVENQPFPNYYTPDGTAVNTYTGVYTITSDSTDFDPSDNTQTYMFLTSETTFAKEIGATRSILPAEGNWEGDGEPHSWAYGNFYHIVDGDNWDAASATFMIGNADDATMAGRLISIYLYRWDEDTNADGLMDPDERTRVALGIYEIQGTEPNTELITVPLSVFPTNEPGPVDIESNTSYVLMVEYVTNDEEDFVMMASDDFDYGAMILRSDLVSPPDSARYGSLLGINGDLESEPYSTVGFGTDLVPVVRLNLAMDVNTNEQLDAANILEVSPNPADTKITLNVELKEVQERANIRIMDINGRLVAERYYDNLQKDVLDFDVSQFANGAYFLHFISEAGIRTERFIVQH